MKKTNRILSVILALVMVLTLCNSFAFALTPADVAANPAITAVSDDGYVTIDYDAALADARIINPAWTGISSGDVSFTFRGTNVVEAYNSDRHFASYDDALAAYMASNPNPVVDAKPVFVFAAGTYDSAIKVPYGAIILGPNAGTSPNAATAWDYTALDGGWAANAAYDTVNEANFSGGISRTTRVDGTATSASVDNMADPDLIESNKYMFRLAKAEDIAGEAANVDIILDGITITGGANVSKDYDIGQVVTDGSELITVAGHRSNYYYLQNSIVRDNSSFYVEAWDTAKNYTNVYFNKVRVTGYTNNSGFYYKGVDEAYIIDSYIGNSNYIMGQGNAGGTNLAFGGSSTSRRDQKVVMKNSFFYNLSGAYVFTMGTNGSWQADPGITKQEFIMDNNILIDASKGAGWGIFLFWVHGVPIYSTITNNVFYEKTHTANTMFNGGDYQKNGTANWYHVFTGNKVIGNINSLGGNLVGDTWSVPNNFYPDVRENYWATTDGDLGKAVSISAAPAAGYSNGYNSSDATYYLDSAMTVLNTDLFIKSIDAGTTGATNASFDNANAAISFDLKTGNAGDLAIGLATGATGGFYSDSACTTPIAQSSIAFNALDQRAYTYYYKVSNGGFDRIYTVTAYAVNADPLASATVDGEIPGSEVVILDNAAASLASDSSYITDWNGDYYQVTVGVNAFGSQADIVSAGKTNKIVLVKSLGTTTDLKIEFPGTFYGQAWNLTPYVKGTAIDGSDWTENADFFAKASQVRNIYIAPTMTGGNVVVKGFITNGYYRDLYRTAYTTPLNVTIENWVINVLSSYTGPAQSANGEGDSNYVFRQGNSGVAASGVSDAGVYGSGTNEDSLTVKAMYMKRVNSGHRLIGEQVNKYTTFDSCWFINNNSIGLTGCAYVKPRIPNSVFTFRNCNFQNFKPVGASGCIMAFESCKNTNIGNAIIFDGNTIRHSGMQTGGDKTLYLLRWYQQPFSRVDFTNNKIFAAKIAADNSSDSDAIAVFHTTGVRTTPIDVTVTGNLYCGGMSNLDLDQGGASAGLINYTVERNFNGGTAVSAAAAESATGTILAFNSAGLTSAMAENLPYYLDMGMTVLSTDVKITDVASNTADIEDVVFDAAAKTLSFTMYDGDSDGLDITHPAGTDVAFYADSGCTTPIAKIVYDNTKGGNNVFFMKCSKNGIGTVYTVTAFFYTTVKDFTTEFADGSFDATNSVVIDNNVASLGYGDEYVFGWKGALYSASVGIEIFESASAAVNEGYDGASYSFLVTSIPSGAWNVSVAGNYYTAAWDTLPYVRGTAFDGSDWTDNAEFVDRSVNVSGNLTFTNAILDQDVGLYGFRQSAGTVRVQNINSTTYNTVTIENYLYDGSGSGYLFTFSVTNNASTRYYNVNTFNLNGAYLKHSTSTWRLMGEACPAHVVIDGLYMDARAANYINNSAYIKQYSYDNLYVIRNSNLRNWVRPNGANLIDWEYANKSDATSSDSNVVKIENNILYNFVSSKSGDSAYLFYNYSNGCTGFEITGNNIIFNAAEAATYLSSGTFAANELFFWNMGSKVNDYIPDGAIAVKDNNFVGVTDVFYYNASNVYPTAEIDISGNFSTTYAEYAANSGDITACFGSTFTLSSLNAGPYDGVGEWFFDYDRTLSSSDTGYSNDYNGVDVDTLNGDVTDIDIGTAATANLKSYVSNNTYSNKIEYYEDDMFTVPVADPTAVGAGSYYAEVLSPDGSQSSYRTFQINIIRSTLDVSIAATAASMVDASTAKIGWRGYVTSSGSLAIDVSSGFADSTRRVGIIYASTNKATYINEAKAAVVAAANGADIDADLAAFNSTATYTRAYSMANTRELYWNDAEQAWTYRYEFNVGAGKTRAAIAFVIFEDANGDPQVMFSDINVQTAPVA